MSKPSSILVSIIIPCYNVENYVRKALNSALEQTHSNIEIICVDNNSTDATLDIIKSYAQKYPKVVTVLTEKKQGAPAARNCGLAIAKGEWIQFLDADDALLGNKIEHQLAIASNDKSKWIIGGRTIVHIDKVRLKYIPWDDAILGLAHGLFAGQTSANLWSKDGFIHTGRWDESLPDTQDTELAFRWILNELPYSIDKTCYSISFDRPSGQITQINPPKTIERHLLLRFEVFKKISKNKPLYWKKNKNNLRNMMLRHIKLLAGHDLNSAEKWFRKIYKEENYLWHNSIFSNSSKQVFLFHLLGFKTTYKLKHLVLKYLKSL